MGTLNPSPTDSTTTTTKCCLLSHPGEYLRLHALPRNRCSETKKYGPNERPEKKKNPEKELTETEITNLSDAEFKALVIRLLTEIVEYGHKIQEEVKAIKSEINKNVQGTNSDGRETRIQINNLDQKEEINIQPEQNEKTRIQKVRRGLGTSRTT